MKREEIKTLKILLLVFLFIASLVLSFIIAGEIAYLFFPRDMMFVAYFISAVYWALCITIFTYAFIKVSKG